ncbi:MAG TPA: SH3 domain-containing protein [Beijerinckiaceae bacterium]|nr:SH3 domain-containing protein [Beijerinckiaceae bacterium]
MRNIAGAAAVFVLCTAPAFATSYCEVVKTADGFAALRAAPGASAKQLARMPSGDMVLLREGERSGWVRVTWCRKGMPEQDCQGRVDGWVNKRLVSDCG